jgi:hypothetical protein
MCKAFENNTDHKENLKMRKINPDHMENLLMRKKQTPIAV